MWPCEVKLFHNLILLVKLLHYATQRVKSRFRHRFLKVSVNVALHQPISKSVVLSKINALRSFGIAFEYWFEIMKTKDFAKFALVQRPLFFKPYGEVGSSLNAHMVKSQWRSLFYSARTIHSYQPFISNAWNVSSNHQLSTTGISSKMEEIVCLRVLEQNDHIGGEMQQRRSIPVGNECGERRFCWPRPGRSPRPREISIGLLSYTHYDDHGG